jgi:hypothetical protein
LLFKIVKVGKKLLPSRRPRLGDSGGLGFRPPPYCVPRYRHNRQLAAAVSLSSFILLLSLFLSFSCLSPCSATGAILNGVYSGIGQAMEVMYPSPRTSVNAVDCRLVRPGPWLWFFRIITHRLSWSFYMSLAPRLELMWVYPMGG